jgi:hypothetical protein
MAPLFRPGPLAPRNNLALDPAAKGKPQRRFFVRRCPGLGARFVRVVSRAPAGARVPCSGLGRAKLAEP